MTWYGLAVARIGAVVVFALPMAAAVGQSSPWTDVAQCGPMVVQSRSAFDPGWLMAVHYVQIVRGRDGELLSGPRLSASEPQPACLNGTAVATRTIAPGSGDVFLDIVGEDGAMTSVIVDYVKDRERPTNIPIILDPAARAAVLPQHLTLVAFENLNRGLIPLPSR